MKKPTNLHICSPLDPSFGSGTELPIAHSQNQPQLFNRDRSTSITSNRRQSSLIFNRRTSSQLETPSFTNAASIRRNHLPTAAAVLNHQFDRSSTQPHACTARPSSKHCQQQTPRALLSTGHQCRITVSTKNPPPSLVSPAAPDLAPELPRLSTNSAVKPFPRICRPAESRIHRKLWQPTPSYRETKTRISQMQLQPTTATPTLLPTAATSNNGIQTKNKKTNQPLLSTLGFRSCSNRRQNTATCNLLDRSSLTTHHRTRRRITNRPPSHCRISSKRAPATEVQHAPHTNSPSCCYCLVDSSVSLHAASGLQQTALTKFQPAKNKRRTKPALAPEFRTTSLQLFLQ
ncbi:hypothetical protein KC19_VG281900 [Ceratodon purpureus]|uniref:Uncharacterized protein n=1 Tax=Ceratodon purpureus TaxID=3225 RepID=A0A8T0HUG5_CERPU|nr:hypothetical protein KC19_VG281900 [Ceratodon purpureus]